MIAIFMSTSQTVIIRLLYVTVFGHGQSILQVFETPIEHGGKCKMSFSQPYWSRFREAIYI